MHVEWICTSLVVYLNTFLRVSEISFSTRGTGYLSWEEAPEEEVARVEGSGRREKGIGGGEGGKGQTYVRETVHYQVLRSLRAWIK